jgi:NAD+ synthase
MLLATGDKTDAATGAAPDAGDYNPIKDLYKSRALDVCRWRNGHHRPWMLGPEGVVIPPRVIENPPPAEPLPGPWGADGPPPSPEELDGILELLVEEDLSVAEVVAAGFDRAVVKRAEDLVYLSERERSRAPPGPRLTRRAFRLDRRYPLVNRWRGEG